MFSEFYRTHVTPAVSNLFLDKVSVGLRHAANFACRLFLK